MAALRAGGHAVNVLASMGTGPVGRQSGRQCSGQQARPRRRMPTRLPHTRPLADKPAKLTASLVLLCFRMHASHTALLSQADADADWRRLNAIIHF